MVVYGLIDPRDNALRYVGKIRASTETHKALAERYGVTPEAISSIKRHATWKVH